MERSPANTAAILACLTAPSRIEARASEFIPHNQLLRISGVAVRGQVGVICFIPAICQVFFDGLNSSAFSGKRFHYEASIRFSRLAANLELQLQRQLNH